MLPCGRNGVALAQRGPGLFGQKGKAKGEGLAALALRHFFWFLPMNEFTRAETTLMIIEPTSALPKPFTWMPLPKMPVAAHAASSSKSAFTTR